MKLVEYATAESQGTEYIDRAQSQQMNQCLECSLYRLSQGLQPVSVATSRVDTQ